MLSITTRTKVGPGRDLDGRAGWAAAEPVVTLVISSSERLLNCRNCNLKMDKRKKRPGGAKKKVSGGGGL